MAFWKKTAKKKPLDTQASEVIVVESLDKYYEQNNKIIHAVSDVNLKISKGEFFVIVGRSGSGKTTLLSLLGAMEKPTSGRIAINGKTLDCLNETELTMLRRLEIATIYQNYNLIPVLTAIQNVELPMILKGLEKEERMNRAKKLLDMVGLLDRYDHKPDELSGGEKQRVAIARSLSNRPEILLLDEPTGNLDAEIKDDVMALIEGINRDLGVTLVMITHDPEIAKRGDRLAKMEKGEIVSIEAGDGSKLRKSEKREKLTADDY